MADTLKNITLVGASGNLGSRTLDSILAHGKHNVTVIARPSSKANYPPSVTVKKGEYKDAAFLESALEGQDVLILMLSFAALPDQHRLFEAAGKAGVKYVLPSTWGAPIGNDKQAAEVPLMQAKRDDHAKIEALGMKWITFVTNGWIDYSLQYGVYGISYPERKATLYTDSAPFVSTTMAQVGQGVANLLCLPESTIAKKFANNYVYLSSFIMTQPDIFAAVLRATGSSEDEWQIKRRTTQELIDEGRKMVQEGDMTGHFKIVYGVSYQPGSEYTNK